MTTKTVIRRSLTSLWAAVALAVAGAFAPIPVRADGATITDLNVSGMSFYDACTAENVTITSGILHLVSQATTDADGGYHITIRGNAQNVVATGDATGTTYHLAGDFWGEQNGREDGAPSVVQLVQLHNVISEGPGANVTIHIVTHVTVDANGVVTADVESINADCSG